MKSKKSPSAVVLLSGGLDSATVLYWAKAQGFKCYCLIFDYGQLHKKEIIYAKKIAQASGSNYQIVKITFPWKGSALLDKKIALPKKIVKGVPSSYVAARNIVFLSFALSFAETIKAQRIFIGAHAQDYSGYPDCRPEFIAAFRRMAQKGMLEKVEISAPLLFKTKAQIIRLGQKLGVPFALTWSCYRGGRYPCGKCDSCYYRAKGFKSLGLGDPLKIKK